MTNIPTTQCFISDHVNKSLLNCSLHCPHNKSMSSKSWSAETNIGNSITSSNILSFEETTKCTLSSTNKKSEQTVLESDL